MLYRVGYVVQFNENHKWCGSLGVIEKVKGNCGRYMIGVPIPEKARHISLPTREIMLLNMLVRRC